MQPLGLIEALKQVPDFRTQPRYPLWVILLLVILGTMNGAVGYRALEAFVLRHQAQSSDYAPAIRYDDSADIGASEL